MSRLPISASCRLRRWRELRPFERQRWRSNEVELRIWTYPASARGSKHVREQVISARTKMGLCDPWWMSRRTIRWQQVQRRSTRARSSRRGRRKRCRNVYGAASATRNRRWRNVWGEALKVSWLIWWRWEKRCWGLDPRMESTRMREIGIGSRGERAQDG
jgi:hypothetical protein